MKKEITEGHLIGSATTLLIAIVAACITISNKVARIEAQRELDRVEQYNIQLSNDKKFDKIDAKMDAISNDTRLILINLQNKADRK